MSAVKICPQCGNRFDDDTVFCPWDGSALRGQGGDLVGQVVAGRFLVQRELGRGGMGEVYLAEQVRIGRPCALKVIKPELVSSPDAVMRFNREASNASRISHPNVVQIYDFGETAEGLVFCAMEYVEGQSLSQLLGEDGTLPPRRAIAIARQVAGALAAAHELGIIHRDLKPDNIMLAASRTGADVVKVVDFGVARVMGDESQKVTSTGLVVGTISYMSPEQFLGSGIDGRSDLYSLAIVTFRMLTGSLPFESANPLVTMEARATGKHRRLDEVRPAVEWPEGLQEVLSRALEADRDRRQASVAAFSAELEAVLNAWMPDESGTSGSGIASVQSASGGAPAGAARRQRAAEARRGPGAGAATGDGSQASLRRRAWIGGIALAAVSTAAALALFVRDRPPEPTSDPPASQQLSSDDSLRAGIESLPPDTGTGAKVSGGNSGRDVAGSKTGATGPGENVPPAESEATRASLDAIRELTRGKLTEDQARQALALLGQLQPRTELGRVEARYYALEAHSVLQNRDEFCRLYGELRTTATGTAFGRGIEAWSGLAESLCR